MRNLFNLAGLAVLAATLVYLVKSQAEILACLLYWEKHWKKKSLNELYGGAPSLYPSNWSDRQIDSDWAKQFKAQQAAERQSRP